MKSVFLRGAGRRAVFGLILALGTSAAWAENYPMPPAGEDAIGEITYTKAFQEDTLLDVARRFSLGQEEIVLANPTVDRWMPRGGTQVLLPKLFILPNVPRTGVVLNIPEMRLYYFRSQSKKAPPTEVVTYPVSIGRMDWKTPRGTTSVLQKQVDPAWHPPETIKKEHAADGDILPDVVPPGPNNPLGKYAMKLGIPGYLIHGTGIDKEFGIGMRVTHGCVRMYPEDIAQLFPLVPVGAPVHITNEPVKIGWHAQGLYIEVHPPLEEDNMGYEQLLAIAMDLLQKKFSKGNAPTLDPQALKAALQTPSGVPVLISKPAEPPAAEEESEMADDPFSGIQ
jgi:L,D-transpeptidase ErfK/SrfK